MKRSITALIALLLLTPLFATVRVQGETGEDEDMMQMSQTSGDDQTDPKVEDDGSGREARIKKLKTALQIKLTMAEKNRLKLRCVAAQGKVSSVGAKFKGIETSRTQVHQNILNRLNNAVTKLKEKGVNTTELEAAITELKTKITTFETD